MRKRYVSKAEWPSDVYTALDGSHISEDAHETTGEADAVCDGLRARGFGGNGPKPIRTWVIDLDVIDEAKALMRGAQP